MNKKEWIKGQLKKIPFLPFTYREFRVIKLRFKKRYTYEKIAKIMKMSKTTICSIILRAKHEWILLTDKHIKK